MKLNDDYVYLPQSDGSFISEKQRRTAEILKDFYPHLELQYIPPVDRGPQDYAFRVIDRTPGIPSYVVCFADQCDERLLARIIQADNSKGNVLNVLEAHDRAIELYNLKKRKEERMELHEIMYSAFRSRKYNWHHKGVNMGAYHERS